MCLRKDFSTHIYTGAILGNILRISNHGISTKMEIGHATLQYLCDQMNFYSFVTVELIFFLLSLLPPFWKTIKMP